VSLRLKCAMGLLGVCASAGVISARPTVGPDVVVSGVGSEFLKFGTRDVGVPGSPKMVTGYAVASTACNIGDMPAIWIDATNQHPVIGQQMYRLFHGRFEQIGMSWLKHSFCAADSPSCTNLVPGSVSPPPDQSCATLGLFMNDTYSGSLNGQQYFLGPRSEVNPATGVFAYPFTLGWNLAGDCLYKRLQLATSDLSPANYPGARYFCEVSYITSDESSAVRFNNASYREVLVGSLTSGPLTGGCTPSPPGYNLSFTGGLAPFKAAIEAWKAIDPQVALVYADVPGDGRVAVGARATALGGGEWAYEYAVYNHNAARGIGSLSVPRGSETGLTLTQIGGNGPVYHSGEPYGAAGWNAEVTVGAIVWATTPHTTDPNASAIRWSTIRNFRFQSNRAPSSGTVTLGLFVPAVAGSGDPATVRVAGLPVPAAACRADFDGVSGVTIQDLFEFLIAYFSGDARADFNGANGIGVQDVFDYLSEWFRGC